MKKILVLLILFFLISCNNEIQNNDCFNNFLNPITISLNSPEMNTALVPNGYAILKNEGLQGIVVFNTGTNGFRAFDLRCPNNDCDIPMKVLYPVLKCECDQNQYSVLDGSLQNGNSTCSARIYTVIKNGNTIQIVN